MAKGKLSNVEKYTIEKMTEEGKDVESIAQFLERTKQTVEKYVDSIEKPQEPQKPKKKTHFVHTTAAKNNKGVTIMTGNESSRAEMSSKNTGSKIKNRFRSSIHEIKDEDG